MIFRQLLVALRSFVSLAIASMLMTGGAASLYAQHSDFEITVENGRLVTDPRIGEAEFGEAPNPPNVANEPGFEAEDGELEPGDLIGFNAVAIAIDGVARNLWFWDGAGSVNFGATPSVPASHELSIEHPLLGFSARLTSAVGASTMSGFTIAQADSEGGLHQDLEFVLVDPSGGDLLPPGAGIYLFGMELTSPSYQTSEPFYFVLGSDVDHAALHAAVEYVEATLIPEPGLLALLTAIGLPLIAVRRRFAA